ncbi:MAG TPA: hypothetical protein VIL35_00390 [Vicinamibacterales bacterium]
MEAQSTRRRGKRLAVDRGQWIELLSSVLMACATVATAWSAYQSALWSSNAGDHRAQATAATIRVAKFTNLALQRSTLHANLFVQWLGAVNAKDTAAADFLLQRVPEPLREAIVAWRATRPLTNPSAPASPFEMAEYTLAERTEAERWEVIAGRETEAAERASGAANRYLLFTIVFASVLFFAGISGKFRWHAIDVTVLALGLLTLGAGVLSLIALPKL